MLCNALPSVEMMMILVVVRTRARAVVGGMSKYVGYDCWACLLLLIDIHTMMMLMMVMFAFVSSLIMIVSYYYIYYNIS